MRHTCVGCGKHSPETETEFTLISAKYGWRVVRARPEAAGAASLEWRCPACWTAYKKAKLEGGESAPDSSPAPQSRRSWTSEEEPLGVPPSDKKPRG